MEIEVPNSLNSIPLRNYQKLMSIKEPTEEQTISILLGISEVFMRNLKSSSVAKLSDHLTSLFKRQHNLQRHFKLHGKEFGFIPSLDDATYGEIKDIERFIGNTDEMHNAMAVMYRPVVKKQREKYIIEEYVPGKYDSLMKDAPLGAVLGANVFFYTLTKDLSNSILNCMKEEVSEAKKKGIFPENGEDMDNYLLSLEVILSGLNKRQN